MTSTTKYLLAHDVGTSGNKSTLFATDGRLIKSIVKPYNTYYSNFTWAEQDPTELFASVCACSKELLKDIDKKAISAVCFTGQMQSVTCINKSGEVLRNSIIYCDQRSEKQALEVVEKVGAKEGYEKTGHRMSPVFAGPKIMWIKENQPDIYKEIYKVLNTKDYLAYMLTGVVATDYSDASGTNLFNLNSYEWDAQLLDAMGIDECIMPTPYESTAVIGCVTKKAEELTGIGEGTPVVIGAGDGIAAAVGAGSINVGSTYTCLGTSGWIGTTTQKPMIDEKLRVDSWCHAFRGKYHVIGVMQTLGTSYKWAKEQLFDNSLIDIETNYEMVNDLIKKSEAGAKGVFFLPYLMGERCPHWTSKLRASFVGMGIETTKGDMLRAVLEGAGYNLKWILNIFKEHTNIEDMLVIGGGAKGEVWRKIMADIYNMKLTYPNNLEEATSMGAAIIGGVGVGVYKSFEDANVFNKVCGEDLPTEQNAKIYEENFKIYKEIFDGLSKVFTEYY